MRAPPYLPADPLPDEDWYADDPALREFLARRLSPDAWKRIEPRLAALGTLGPRVLHGLACDADAFPPELAANEVRFHGSYPQLAALAREHRVFTDAWHGGSRLTSLALGYLYAQAECGYFCPACMTDGAAFVLERHGRADLAARLVQAATEGAWEGAMFLTEETGGSDVGASTTRATQADGAWRLDGAKWFCSNANAGLILALARMPGGAPGTRGLGLFAIRGDAAGLRRLRLKDKLGVRSMATAECELVACEAELIAGENEGFKAMAEMVNLSRLYNAVTSVAVARRALREGQKNGAWRRAFGGPLSAKPLYQRAVAGLAVDVRGALLLVLDAADHFERDRPLTRALVCLAKAETARLAVRAASEGCELLGGNGYVRPWVTERLLRDAQVLPIWEGTSNIQALDLLRGIAKEGAGDALLNDSLARLPSGHTLAREWRAWADDARAMDELASARVLSRGYHLRAATLLAAEAEVSTSARTRSSASGDAPLWADAYRIRNVERDERGFEGLVRARADELCGWPAV